MISVSTQSNWHIKERVNRMTEILIDLTNDFRIEHDLQYLNTSVDSPSQRLFSLDDDDTRNLYNVLTGKRDVPNVVINDLATLFEQLPGSYQPDGKRDMLFVNVYKQVNDWSTAQGASGPQPYDPENDYDVVNSECVECFGFVRSSDQLVRVYECIVDQYANLIKRFKKQPEYVDVFEEDQDTLDDIRQYLFFGPGLVILRKYLPSSTASEIYRIAVERFPAYQHANF